MNRIEGMKRLFKRLADEEKPIETERDIGRYTNWNEENEMIRLLLLVCQLGKI